MCMEMHGAWTKSQGGIGDVCVISGVTCAWRCAYVYIGVYSYCAYVYIGVYSYCAYVYIGVYSYFSELAVILV